jgi:hypothetical protein
VAEKSSPNTAQLGPRTQIAGEHEKPKGVVGVVVAPKFPDLGIIREKIEEGIARVSSDTVWVIREKPQANHSVNAVWETLAAHGIEPFIAPLLPCYKADGRRYREIRGKSGRVVVLERIAHPATYDLRRVMRDAEMHSYCERIVVFHDITSHVTAEFVARKDRSVAKIFVIERGKKKAPRQRQGRKPVGV